jgi:methyl-accepting chemotaxis protein
MAADNKFTDEQLKLAKDYQDIITSINITLDERIRIENKILNGSIKTTDQLIDELDTIDKINDSQKTQVEQQKAANKLRNDAIEREENILELNKEIIKKIENQIKNKHEISDLGSSIYAVDKKIIENKIKEVESERSLINQKILSGDLTAEQQIAYKHLLDTLDSEEQALKRLNAARDSKFGRAVAASYDLAAEKAEELGAGVEKMFEGLPAGGAISKILGLDDASAKMKEGVNAGFAAMNDEMAKGGGLMGSLKAGMAGFNTMVMANPMLLVVGAATALWSILSDVDKEASSIATNTNMNFAASERLYESTLKRNTRLNEQLATTKDIVAVQEEVIKTMGSTAQLTTETASAVADLGKSYGYGADTAGQVQATMMEMGATAEDAAAMQSSLAADATRSYVDAGAVMSDIAQNGKMTLKYLGGNTKELQKTAIAGAKLGLNLEQIVGIADGLLDIENSLTKQYEFQALSGKQINLDKARELALSGDLAGMAEEVSKQAGSYADFQKMGRLERETLAESLGMEVEDLAKSLAIQQQRGKLTKDEMAAAQGLGKTAEELAKMSDEDIKKAIAQKNESDAMAKNWEDMKETLKSYLLPIATALGQTVMSIANGVKSVLTFLAPVGDMFGAIWNFLGPIQGAVKWIGGGLLLWLVAAKLYASYKQKQLNKTLEQYEFEKRVKAMQDEQAAATNKVANNIQQSADNAQQLANNAQHVDSNLKGAVKDATALSDEMAEAATNAQNIQPGGGPQDAAIGGGGAGGGKGLLGKAKGLLGKAGGMLGLGGGGGLMGAASGFLNSDLGGMVKEKGIEMAMGSIMGVGDLAINPNGGPVVTSPREGGIYQGTKNDGVSMSPSHGGGGGSAPAIDYNALGAAVAAAIAANPPVVHMDGAKVSQSVTATQSRNKGL